jgi:hypothetical protein
MNFRQLLIFNETFDRIAMKRKCLHTELQEGANQEADLLVKERTQ